MGVFHMVWAPFKHIFMASGESVQKLGSGAGKIVKTGVNTVRGVGNSFSKHANMAVRNISRRKGRNASKMRKTRKARG